MCKLFSKTMPNALEEGISIFTFKKDEYIVRVEPCKDDYSYFGQVLQFKEIKNNYMLLCRANGTGEGIKLPLPLWGEGWRKADKKEMNKIESEIKKLKIELKQTYHELLSVGKNDKHFEKEHKPLIKKRIKEL